MKEILKIDKLSYFYPRIFQYKVDDYDMSEIKEGVIVKYRAGECKCIVTKVTNDIITINDNSHCKYAERKIKVGEFKSRIQIIKFAQPTGNEETKEITSVKELSENDFLIDDEGKIWKVSFIVDEFILNLLVNNIMRQKDDVLLDNETNDSEYVTEKNIIKNYKKLIGLEFK